MKKLLSILMLTAMVFCASSCGSDDDNSSSGQGTYASVAAEYSLEFSDEMLAMCVITAKYTGENGTTVSEAVTSNKWSKKVKINKALTEASLEVYLSKKDGVDYTENSPYAKTGSTGKKYMGFSLNAGNITAATYDSKGNEIARRSSDLITKELMCMFDKLDDLFDPATSFRDKTLNISANGENIY